MLCEGGRASTRARTIPFPKYSVLLHLFPVTHLHGRVELGRKDANGGSALVDVGTEVAGVLLERVERLAQRPDVGVEVRVRPVVGLELRIDLLDLSPERTNLGLAGLDLPLELLDLVVEDELELLQLLVLLLQLVDALFPLADDAVFLVDHAAQSRNVLLQRIDA